MSSLLSDLNPQQQEAVTLPRESALILAGAGSGKTRVLTTRIAWLIRTGQASPHSILAVTFTNKAAREVLTRVSAMLPVNPRGMWIGTFHGLCHRLLRAHSRDAGLAPTFQILDSADQLSVIKRLLKTLNIDDEKYPPRMVAGFINNAKEAGLRASQVEAEDPISRKLAEIYAAYDEQCNREAVVDFAELLLRSYELLARNEMLLEHYRNRFAHVLVDEFQDTNRLQYRWLSLLAGGGNAVFAVGDDDQSIYAFRGAIARNMQEFAREFGVARVIRLEQNYRSQSNILDAANALIRHNRARLGKNLWTDTGSGEPLKAYEAANDIEEAEFVVDEVKSLRREGLRASDIAILYRSNAQSRVLEHALFSAGLPYRVYGGLRFFERQEIKHALAYLRLAADPNDEAAFLRVVNFPPRGVGARTLEQLQDLAREREFSLWQAAIQKTADKRHKAAPGRGVDGFVALIESICRESATLTLPELTEKIIEASGLNAYYEAEKDGQDRLANLDELINAAALFVSEPREEELEPLIAFVAHAALEAGEHQAGGGDDALQLMTVHAAKGLEFKAVFITGLEEGLFPHENSLTEREGVEEERRLMYVALTRARERLYLSYAQSRMLHGQTRFGIASRFLTEIPAELIKRINAPLLRPVFTSIEPAKPKSVRLTEMQDATSDWRIGQNVVHSKFGAGVIVNAEGRGASARVQVNFRNAGLKWLALEYAKLTPA
jgi:DNA helicase-2/ATP-dependent DNA helicase PcrA